MTNDIIELKGKKVGPMSIILVGIHGNEKCGVEALEKILPTLKIENGTVFFAYGNPEAIKKNVRFTEANLNRMFKPEELMSEQEKNSYEYSRSRFLLAYLKKSDYLLDIHASTSIDSRRFVICEENANLITSVLPVDLIVSGFDKVEPGGTDYYMNKIGKIGICIECGYLGDPKSTETAEESISSFLMATGNIKGDISEKYTQTRIKMTGIYYTHTNNFRLAKEFKDFEELKQGQLIGYDDDEEIIANSDSIILFAQNTKTKGDEAFLIGEYIL